MIQTTANGAPSPWDIAYKEFECAHPRTVTAFFVTRNNQNRYGHHCVRCGNFRAISKADLTDEQRRTARLRDEEIQKRFCAQRTARYDSLRQLEEAKRAMQDAAWRAQYEAHIRSEKWYRIRAKVIKRAGGVCEGCLERPAVQAHHLTYKHLGDEFMWELRAVCIECHERFHG